MATLNIIHEQIVLESGKLLHKYYRNKIAESTIVCEGIKYAEES